MFDLDWQAPWFKGFERHGQEVMVLWSAHKSLSRALNHYAQRENFLLDSKVHLTPSRDPSSGCLSGLSSEGSLQSALNGIPLFVAQQALPTGEAYESFISRTHHVPTRDNLHDFFNALCWFRFPLTKSYLNEQQALAIEALGHVHARGALRDALTLLDENACFVWCEDVLWERLKSHDWLSAFWLERESWMHVRVELFGHALLEKLCAPYKAITAHAIRALPFVPFDSAETDLTSIALPTSSSTFGPSLAPSLAPSFAPCSAPGSAPLVALNPTLDPTVSPSASSQVQKLSAPSKAHPLTPTDQHLDQAMLSTLRSLQLSKKPFQALPVLGVPGWFKGNEVRGFYEDPDVFRPRRKKVQL
jgi:hypothetical protein